MSGFGYHATAVFAGKYAALARTDPAAHRRVAQVIARLLAHPERNDGPLHGPHRGRLKKYVGRSGWRVIFDWCHACRDANRRQAEGCPFCGTIPDESVIFFDLYHKNEAARLGYG